MEAERNLLFGVIAFQNGTLDADRLAESCAHWVGEPSVHDIQHTHAPEH